MTGSWSEGARDVAIAICPVCEAIVRDGDPCPNAPHVECESCHGSGVVETSRGPVECDCTHAEAAPTCVGIAAHAWTFGVEEGQAYVHTEPCGDTCWFKHGLGDEREWLYMEPMKVQVGMATDCPAYDQDSSGVATTKHPMRGYESGSHYIAHGSHCDCNWWPVVVVASRAQFVLNRLAALVEAL